MAERVEQDKVAIPINRDVYERLNYLKAQLSAQKAHAISWDELLELFMKRERQRRELISWLHTLGIFVAITFVLMPHLYLVGPFYAMMILPVFILISIVVALFSAYVLTPWALRGIKPYNDAPPEILQALQGLATQAQLKRPLKLMIAETPEINAMAYTSISSDRICVTRGLIMAYQSQRITFEDLKAVLGHELGHIRNFDTLKWAFVTSWISLFDAAGAWMMTLGRGMAGIGIVLSEATEQIVITQEGEGRYVVRREAGTTGVVMALTGWALYIGGVVQKLLAKLASALAFYLSRKQEFMADEIAAALTSPQHMASVLRKIEDLNKELIAEQVASLPYTDRWQLQPRNPSWVDALFDSHPPTEDREARLQAIDKYL
jgi:Zn-dependent protease with chaperone function